MERMQSDASQFRSFITNILQRGNLKPETIDQLVSEKNLMEYRKAFTHRSADKGYDYDYYEFFGDLLVNEVIGFNIRRRLPNVVTVKFLTRIKHTLMSNKILGILAHQNGWTKYLVSGEEVTELINRNLEKDREVIYKIYADLFEAFCGCTVILIESLGHPHGAAVQVVHNIMNTYLDTITIPKTYEEIFDPITRLKEMYESKALGIRWPSGEKSMFEGTKRQAYAIAQLPPPDGRYEVVVYGWPLGDRSVMPRNEVALARAYGYDKKETKKQAAEWAMMILRTKYGIIPPTTEFR